jgi:hypothetical protein
MAGWATAHQPSATMKKPRCLRIGAFFCLVHIRGRSLAGQALVEESRFQAFFKRSFCGNMNLRASSSNSVLKA